MWRSFTAFASESTKIFKESLSKLTSHSISWLSEWAALTFNNHGIINAKHGYKAFSKVLFNWKGPVINEEKKENHEYYVRNYH